MAVTSSRAIINLVDAAEVISESDEDQRTGRGKKRKLDEDFSEKIHWTDESDTVPTKPKRRRAPKRKSTEKRRSDVHAEGIAEAPEEDELELSGAPDYVQQRRREFQAARERCHDAALMLPPKYFDVHFDETRRLGDLEERPQFDEKSGIKPSRPYEDIELPHSAGLIPASIARYLRDYQIEGVKFLHRKFVYQEGAILGDDMGLGKTVQVAALLAAAFGKTGDERDDKRMRQMRRRPGRWYPKVLIICPGSLIMNWKQELTRWGWWHIDLFHGSTKDDVLGTARAGLLEVMITTYDTYKNSRSAINLVQWDAVIADECHRIKDKASQTTRAMMEVNALCRIGLTGTAIQNRYEELWTLLDWTNPGQFDTLAQWRHAIAKPLTIGQSHEATMAQLKLGRDTAEKLVQNLLPRYFLRRMKSLIADQLPKKTDRVVFCPLTDLQREAYENFTECNDIKHILTVGDVCEHGKKQGWCCQTELPNGTPWQNVIFPCMQTLQKLASHLTLLVPLTTDLENKQQSELEKLQVCVPKDWKELYAKRDQTTNLVNPEYCGKWKILKKLLKFWHGTNDKVLVFSHSVRLLRIFQHLFSNTSYNVCYLDGSLSYEARQDMVDTFNSDPQQFVFLISTKAGGVGLNITSANKVVIVDPHWNPAYDLQAQDRAYRIGQTRDVEVFRLVSTGTIEEIVYARQIYKQQQANIGYTASSERRYFKGVQQNQARKGEIFGLENIFTYHTESGLLRDIVNKTNVAEARAGVGMMEVDMEQAANDQEEMGLVKKEDDNEDGGMSQLAELLKSKDQQKFVESRKTNVPKTDAIHAILTSAGVEYTHENSEVIGSSKVEEQLSRQAAAGSFGEEGDLPGRHVFANSQDVPRDNVLHSKYNPPEDVCLRQFCEMAREFGFANATDFALVAESWTQEQRRNCLDSFYRRREAKSVEEQAKKDEGSDGHDSDCPKCEQGSQSSRTEPLKQGEGVDESLVKGEQDKEEKPNMTTYEGERKIKVEGSSKRASIFLSDDDDDDEL